MKKQKNGKKRKKERQDSKESKESNEIQGGSPTKNGIVGNYSLRGSERWENILRVEKV